MLKYEESRSSDIRDNVNIRVRINSRKRNDYNDQRGNDRERKSERSELRPPDTSTPPHLNTSQIIILNTYFNSIAKHLFSANLNTIICIIYITHNNTINCFSGRLLSSANTASLLEGLQITPFTSVLGSGSFIVFNNKGTSVSLSTITVIIVVYFSYISTNYLNCFEHLIENVAGFRSVKCSEISVKHLIEVHCSF